MVKISQNTASIFEIFSPFKLCLNNEQKIIKRHGFNVDIEYKRMMSALPVHQRGALPNELWRFIAGFK